MTNKIVKTIEKLLRHAESASKIGSPAEAEAFAVQARKLMTEHKIETSELCFDEVGHEEVERACVLAEEFGQKNARKTCFWQAGIADALAPAYYCSIAISAGTNALRVYGTRTDRERYVQALRSVLSTATAMCSRDHARAYNAHRSFKRSWYSGFAHGLRVKVQDEIAREKIQSESTALVVINNAMEKVEEMMSVDSLGKRTSNANTSDAQARNMGYIAGNGQNQLG